MADPNNESWLVHDIPLIELDGLHVKSSNCPCEPDIEMVTARRGIVYHQRRSGSAS